MSLDLNVPVTHDAFAALCRGKVPMVRKTFPVLETTARVRITKSDQFWRANGKIVAGGFARYLIGLASKNFA